MKNKKFIFIGSGLILIGVVGLVTLTMVAYQRMTTPVLVVPKSGVVLGVNTTGILTLNGVDTKVTSVQTSVNFSYSGNITNLKVVPGISSMDYALKNIRQDKRTGVVSADIVAVNSLGVDLSRNQILATIVDKSKSLKTDFTFNKEMSKVYVLGSFEPIVVDFKTQ